MQFCASSQAIVSPLWASFLLHYHNSCMLSRQMYFCAKLIGVTPSGRSPVATGMSTHIQYHELKGPCPPPQPPPPSLMHAQALTSLVHTVGKPYQCYSVYLRRLAPLKSCSLISELEVIMAPNLLEQFSEG